MVHDGSSHVEGEIKRARYTIVSLQQTIEASPLPPGTSAQKVEMIALTYALELDKDLGVHIYKDSSYAFLVLHAHTAIWKEQKLLTARNFPI